MGENEQELRINKYILNEKKVGTFEKELKIKKIYTRFCMYTCSL